MAITHVHTCVIMAITHVHTCVIMAITHVHTCVIMAITHIHTCVIMAITHTSKCLYYQEKFETTKGVIRSCNSTNRQYILSYLIIRFARYCVVQSNKLTFWLDMEKLVKKTNDQANLAHSTCIFQQGMGTFFHNI
jgi:hypothetical protein